MCDNHIVAEHMGACQWLSTTIGENITSVATPNGGMIPSGQGMTDVGRLIRNRRQAIGFTQVDLFQRTGIEQYYISQIERGKVKQPGKGFLLQIAEAMEMDPNTLLIAADYAPLNHGAYQQEQEVRPEDVAHGAQRVSFWGRVPADTLRWVASQSEGERVTVPGLFIGTREIETLFVVQASGDCLIRRKIADGQLVLCEKPDGRLPRNNQVVAIRVGDERSLKVFHRDGDTITLRDGDNNITATLTIDDDIEVVGFVIATWWGQFD
jgi:transcriptional regulator with XRE-family HTH domain